MGRLVNGEREINPKPEYAGKLLLFCEGFTEYNYFSYFKNYLLNNLKAEYSNIVIEPINTKGNAMNVLKFAEDYMEKDVNIRRFKLYEKHLIFDCDNLKNIQEVIRLMKESKNEYVLDLSSLLFETWLVMHYENLKPDNQYKKGIIFEKMRDFLKVTKYTSKIKANPGTIGKILGNGGNERIREAIKNAKEIEEYWKQKGNDYEKDIKNMNPYIRIHELVERLLDEIVYLC